MSKSLHVLYAKANGLVRAGAMRKLAQTVAQFEPNVLAICEIGSGDARSLATRFALHWAYRGRQAIFWRGFEAHDVADLYLPARTPLARTGFICVEGKFAGIACTLAATQFARTRDPRVAQLRFVRTHLRTAKPDALFFACLFGSTGNFTDIGFRRLTENARAGQQIYVRGFEAVEIQAQLAEV